MRASLTSWSISAPFTSSCFRACTASIRSSTEFWKEDAHEKRRRDRMSGETYTRYWDPYEPSVSCTGILSKWASRTRLWQQRCNDRSSIPCEQNVRAPLGEAVHRQGTWHNHTQFPRHESWPWRWSGWQWRVSSVRCGALASLPAPPLLDSTRGPVW